MIKENCDFQYYFNNTEVKPAFLDGGHEIVLANWPNNKCVICNDNKYIPIKFPSHPYICLIEHFYVIVEYKWKTISY